MPVSQGELNAAGKTAIEFYLRNNPIDNIAVERPFLRKLMTSKKSFPGGKQYVVEQLRYRYQNNFTWFHGDQEVSYNKRATIEQAQYEWRSAHDGFSLNEDDLLRNGITITDGPPRVNSQAQVVQLTNLFEEDVEALRLGFEEQLSQGLHKDGTQDAEAIEGLDFLISYTPGNDDAGGIDASAQTWWQNYSAWNSASASKNVSISSSNIIAEMEIAWRKCIRNGGTPNFIMMGDIFLDTFRTAAKSEISRYTILNTGGQQAGMDPAIGPVEGVSTGLHFHGVPITWNPEFEDLDTAYASDSPDWEDRCYMINCRHLRLRPAQGHDLISRNPPRVYNRYAYYWGLTWKGALTTGRRNAHACLAIAQ